MKLLPVHMYPPKVSTTVLLRSLGIAGSGILRVEGSWLEPFDMRLRCAAWISACGCVEKRWIAWLVETGFSWGCHCHLTTYTYTYTYTYTHMHIHMHVHIHIRINTSSTAQGSGGSFKNRKPIGEVACCGSRMAERSHWWIDRWLRSLLFLSLSLSFSLFLFLSVSFSDYLPTYPPIFVSISLSLSLCLSVCLSIDRSIDRSIYLSAWKLANQAILRDFLSF